MRLFSVKHGEADMVLAGAAEAPLNPWSLMAFSRIRALSMETQAQRASRPFDAARDGFVMAEGAAALVLEAWPSPTSSLAQPHIAEVLGFGRSGQYVHEIPGFCASCCCSITYIRF